MVGNQSVKGSALRSHVAGEKPVLNELWDFREAMPDDNRQWQAVIPETEKIAAGEAVQDDGKFKKGMRLFILRRWEDALQEFLDVDIEGAGSGERLELAYYLGLCCTKLERYDDALGNFEQVITADEDPVRVYQCRMILAYIYIITGRAKLAETELKNLQDSGMESVMLYNTLAYAAYAQKHYLGAVEFYEKALDLDQDNATALNSLGYVLADTGLDKLKGLRLCRKAVDKNPQNPAYLDSLGWAYYRNGKLKEAGNWLRQAANIAPQNADIKKHISIITGEAL